MKVEDVSALLNSAASQMSDGVTLLENDLSNAVDFGRSIQNIYADDMRGYDLLLHKLPDQFNKIKTWAKPYITYAPSVYMENETYGSIRAMYKTDYLPAVEADMWNVQDGADYSPDVVSLPDTRTTFWNGRFSSAVQHKTIFTEQWESAFQTAQGLMEFVGMLEMARQNSHGRQWDNMIMTIFQALINMCFESGGMKDIQLLTEYNTKHSTSLTAAQAMENQDFIRYAIYRMSIVRNQMRALTSMFSRTGFLQQTPEDRQKVVYIADFASAAGVYLHDAPNQFNVGNLKIPNATTVPCWQGMGTAGDLADRMTVKGKITLQVNGSMVTYTNTVPGVIGVVYDSVAMGISAYKHDITSHFIKRVHGTNYFDQMMGGFFIDPDLNSVIFRLA